MTESRINRRELIREIVSHLADTKPRRELE
jgi:hypothetical protein